MCLTNASGLRLGITKKWEGNWFSNKNHYGIMVNANLDIKKFFKGLLYYNWKKSILIEMKLNKNSLDKIILFIFFYKPVLEKKKSFIFFLKWLQKKAYILNLIEKYEKKEKNYNTKELDKKISNLLKKKKNWKKIDSLKNLILYKNIFKPYKKINLYKINKELFLKSNFYKENIKTIKSFYDIFIEKKKMYMYKKISYIFYQYLKKKIYKDHLYFTFKNLTKTKWNNFLFDIQHVYINIYKKEFLKKSKFIHIFNQILYNMFIYFLYTKNKKKNYIFAKMNNILKKYEKIIWLSKVKNNNIINKLQISKKIKKWSFITYIIKYNKWKNIKQNNLHIKNLYLLKNLFLIQKNLKKNFTTINIFDTYNFKNLNYLYIKMNILYMYYKKKYICLIKKNNKYLNMIKLIIKYKYKFSNYKLFKFYNNLTQLIKKEKSYKTNDNYNKIVKLIKINSINKNYKINNNLKNRIKNKWPLYKKKKWNNTDKNKIKFDLKKKIDYNKLIFYNKKSFLKNIFFKKQVIFNKILIKNYKPFKIKKRSWYKWWNYKKKLKKFKRKFFIKKTLKRKRYKVKNFYMYKNLKYTIFSKNPKYLMFKNTKKVLSKLTKIHDIKIIFINVMKFMLYDIHKRDIKNVEKLKKLDEYKNKTLVKDTYNFFNILLAGLFFKKPILISEIIGKIISEIPKNKLQTSILRFISVSFNRFSIMNKEIKGIRIKLKGRFNKRRRSKSYIIKNKDSIKNVTLVDKMKLIEYGQSYSLIKNGLVGIKIWIYFDSTFFYKFLNKFNNFWERQKLKKNKNIYIPIKKIKNASTKTKKIPKISKKSYK